MKLIRNVKQKKPFSIVYVQHPLTDDMNDDGEPVVQVLVYKRDVGPSRLLQGACCLSGAIGRQTMTGLCSENMNCLKKLNQTD